MTGELTAWRWLLLIPRIGFHQSFRKQQQQVQIHAIPGRLDAVGGAPLLRVSIAHPDLPAGTRIRGSGNSLWEAVERISVELRRAGVTSMPSLYAMQAEENQRAAHAAVN